MWWGKGQTMLLLWFPALITVREESQYTHFPYFSFSFLNMFSGSFKSRIPTYWSIYLSVRKTKILLLTKRC